MPARMHPRPIRSRSNGFSLLEVVIAMGILAFGLLTLALMQVHALTQGAAGRHTGDAAAIARTAVEQVHRLPWSTLDGSVGAGWATPSWDQAPKTVSTEVKGPSGDFIEHTYDVEWRVSAIAGTTCLRNVEVRVTWEEEDRSTPKAMDLATSRYNWKAASC